MERAGLDVIRVRAALSERFPQIDVVDEVGSTNAELMATAGAADRTVLAAEFQNAGRGRLDRAWSSPPRAGVTVSVLLRPEVPMSHWGWLPLMTGLAVRDAVASIGASAVHLKWPNDVLVGEDDRKLAGILAQTRPGVGGQDTIVVIGVGVNVTTTAEEFGDVAGSSLVLAGVANPDRTELLIALLRELDHQVARWEDVGGDAEACGLAAAYRDACSTLGRQVTVLGIDGSETSGIASGIDANGHLLLDVNGAVQTVAAGDVRHARPLR